MTLSKTLIVTQNWNRTWALYFSHHSRSSHRTCSVKKGFLEISQNSQENTCARVSYFNKSILIKSQAKACNFIKIETLAQVFSCEFCEISKKIFFTEHLWTTTSVTPILIQVFVFT